MLAWIASASSQTRSALGCAREQQAIDTVERREGCAPCTVECGSIGAAPGEGRSNFGHRALAINQAEDGRGQGWKRDWNAKALEEER